MAWWNGISDILNLFNFLRKQKQRAVLKGALSGLRQLLASENPLKMMKKYFLLQLKSSSCS